MGFVSSSYLVQANTLLYPHDSKPFNSTMAKWLEKYWIWVASIPADAPHPRLDTTGNHCGDNQNGPVWFLDHYIDKNVKKIYNCEIPEGKAIFIPLLVAECDSGDIQPPTVEEISKCAWEGNEGGNTQLSIDDKLLLVINNTNRSEKHYSLYRTNTTDFFKITLAFPNVFDVPGGTFDALADGYFAIVQPLPVGDHKIHYKTNVYSPINHADYDQDIEITFNIKINKIQNASVIP
jgi:hypothetical protein